MPIENETKVRHRQDGYVGFIDGLTEICKGPKRNPDGKTQYRVRVEGKKTRELATEDELEIIKMAPRRGKRFNVYVVQLQGVPGGTGKDVYVGMTGLTPEERFARYCQLKSDWANFLPWAGNPNAEQSMSYEFVYGLIFGQIHLT